MRRGTTLSSGKSQPFWTTIWVTSFVAGSRTKRLILPTSSPLAVNTLVPSLSSIFQISYLPVSKLTTHHFGSYLSESLFLIQKQFGRQKFCPPPHIARGCFYSTFLSERKLCYGKLYVRCPTNNGP